MDNDHPAGAAGTVVLGDRRVNRMGFGAMRLPGPRVWGEPANPDNARAVVRRAVELGVQVIDTAGYYGDHVADRIIAEAIHPYPGGVVIVTKVGAARDPDGSWRPASRPDDIRSAIEDDLIHLRLDRIDLVHCRYSSESGVPLSESLGALVELRNKGIVGHIGLSNISAPQLAEGQQLTPIVSVQNRYSVSDREHDDVLDACTAQGIPFMPFFPLAVGEVARASGALASVSARHGATPAQIALAWLLARSPIMLPIPGTGSLDHLEENVAAAAITPSSEDMAELNASIGD
jgi:aryl-alcohol dehydrogenase-like predicted oxidoreductase